MIAVAGAAVVVIPRTQRASPRRCKRASIAEAHASSFSSDSFDKELKNSFDRANGTGFSGRRNATQRFAREESSNRGTFHDQGKHSWQDPSSDAMRQAGSMSLGNAHPQSHVPDRDHGVDARDFFPFQKLSESSFEEQQHHGFDVKMHRRIPLPSRHRRSRMHNNFSVFEGVRQPSLGIPTRKHASALSRCGETVDSAPSNSSRRILDLPKSRFKENFNRGVRFSPKFPELLPNLKKEESGSREIHTSKLEKLSNSTAFAHAGQGFQSATSEGKKAEESRVIEPWENKSRQQAKCVSLNDGKAVEINHREARFLSNKGADHVKVSSSRSSSEPWETERKHESTFECCIPIRRETVSISARRSSTSIGSRSSPSRSSVQFRNGGHSRFELHGATVGDPSKLLTEYEPEHLSSEHRKGIDLSATQNFSQKGPLKAGLLVESLDFDWTDSDSEGDGDDALPINVISEKNATEEKFSEEDENPSFGPSALLRQGISNWSDVDSKTVNNVKFESPLNSPHHQKEHEVSHVDSDAEDMGTSESDSRGRFTHDDKEQILSTAMQSPVDMASGPFRVGGGSNHTIATASWHKHDHPDLSFEFQFSYSENPKAPILGYREIPYSPFGPSNRGRPWTGAPPHKPSKKKQRVFDSFNPPKDKKGVKYVQDPGPYPEGQGPQSGKSREEIMGDPLTNEEIVSLVQKCERENRQLNLGRDGLTHNMLAMIHDHWKRRRVCKIKCKGVPTMDMDNVKFHIEDKTGGKIIYQAGGVLYLFRGRNYNYKDCPHIPLMLWKPVAPIYPKLIQPAPGGLTKERAQKLRDLGQKAQPICRLGKNGVYINLVKDVQAAFKMDELVRIDCGDLYPRDYKKIGAKLKDLVPCILLSFEGGHILMWKGKQDPAVERSSQLDFEPQLADAEVFKHSTTDNVCDSDTTTEEKLNTSVAEASDSTLAREGEMEEKTDLAHVTEVEIEENLYQLYSEQESASGVAAASALQMTKEHWEISSSISGETDLDTNISASKRLDTTDRRFHNETESEGADVNLEGMSKAVKAEGRKDGHNSVVQSQTASSGSFSTHAVKVGYGSDRDEVIRRFDSESDMKVRLDALWDDAVSSGRAVEVAESDMDDDMILRKAAEHAESAPAGPKYTLNLIYKLMLKRTVDRENDVLHIHFGKVPVKIPKKVAKQKADLPTWDVPGMGGLPVDGLAKLLALKQPT